MDIAKELNSIEEKINSINALLRWENSIQGALADVVNHPRDSSDLHKPIEAYNEWLNSVQALTNKKYNVVHFSIHDEHDQMSSPAISKIESRICSSLRSVAEDLRIKKQELFAMEKHHITKFIEEELLNNAEVHSEWLDMFDMRMRDTKPISTEEFHSWQNTLQNKVKHLLGKALGRRISYEESAKFFDCYLAAEGNVTDKELSKPCNKTDLMGNTFALQSEPNKEISEKIEVSETYTTPAISKTDDKIHINKARTTITQSPEDKSFSSASQHSVQTLNQPIKTIDISQDSVVLILSKDKKIILKNENAEIVGFIIRTSLWRNLHPDLQNAEEDYYLLRSWHKSNLLPNDLYLIFRKWEDCEQDVNKALSEKVSRIRRLFEENGLESPVEIRTRKINRSISFNCLDKESKLIEQSILNTMDANDLIKKQLYPKGLQCLCNAISLDPCNWEAHLLLCNILGTIERDWSEDIKTTMKNSEVVAEAIGCIKRYKKLCQAEQVELLDSAETGLEKHIQTLYGDDFRQLWEFILNIKNNTQDIDNVLNKFDKSKAGKNLKQKVSQTTFSLLKGKKAFISEGDIENYYTNEIYAFMRDVDLWRIRDGNYKKALGYLSKSISYRIADRI